MRLAIGTLHYDEKWSAMV